MQKFRSQLLLDEQRFLFDVWLEAAQGQEMPSRRTFSPCAFGPVLPYVSLIEINNNATAKIRVAGSGLRNVFGADPYSELLNPEIEGNQSVFNQICKSKKPLCGVSVNNVTGRVRYWLRLPLGISDNVEHIVGLDLNISGNCAPNWVYEKIKSHA